MGGFWIVSSAVEKGNDNPKSIAMYRFDSPGVHIVRFFSLVYSRPGAKSLRRPERCP